jgi:hypothetical protein
VVTTKELMERVSFRIRAIAGVALVLGSVLVPLSAQATNPGTQMGARSVTATTSKAGATPNYSLSFTPGTAGANLGAIKVEVCDSPLETVACAASGSAGVNSNGANVNVAFTASTALGGVSTVNSWSKNTGTSAGAGGTNIIITNSSAGGVVTTSTPSTFSLTNVTNPAGNNQKFYVRVTTYNSTSTFTGTQEIDFGAVALMTNQDIVVTASVQESLQFCTGITVGGACASVGAGAVPLGTGSGCPILSTANNCTGTSQMAAATNGNSGYSITYNGSTFAGPNDVITATGTPGATSTINSKQFGLAVTSKTGAGSGAINTAGTNYDFSANGSKYAYVTGSPQTIAAAAGATAENVYTITYVANIDNTTKPGNYTATINYVCTGLF